MRARRISDTICKVDDKGVRGSQRVPLDASVIFLQPVGITGQAVDVNHSGMRVMVDEPLLPGQKCIAVVRLSSGDDLHERMEVIWSRRAQDGWEVGLAFAS